MADRISMLPDDILCHILSFLPTKVAIATTLLSKKWNPLWLSISTLDFEYTNELKFVEEDINRFINFIESVISSHDVNQSIKRFRLVSKGLCDDSYVDKWVNVVVQRGLEHLDLDLSSWLNGVPNLPSAALSCGTLVVLKLCSIGVKTLYSVYLPSLKILDLSYMKFSQRQYLMEILSACPTLEFLKLKRLSNFGSYAWENKSENILPVLVKADICQYRMLPLKAVYNVQILRLDEVEFRCYNDIPVFQNLTELNLIFESFSWQWMVELLKHCPKLQILVIDKTKVGKIYEENWAYPQHVPECLSLHLKTCTLKLYVGLEGDITFARYIMQNARVLQTMACVLMNDDQKLEISTKLSLCPRSSATCQLIVEHLQVEDFLY